MTRLVRLALITSVALVSAVPAFAQNGPSFECAKASNDVERTICKDPKLAKADRAMAEAYAALAAKLSGPAKDNLEKEQVRWLGDRNRGCAADTDGIAPSLTRRYAARTTNLLASAEGIYPFISEQSLSENAKLGKITYSYDISYPKFDGTSANFTAVNARSANPAKKAVAYAPPRPAGRPIPGSTASRGGPTSRASRSIGRAPTPSPSRGISTASAAARTAS